MQRAAGGYVGRTRELASIESILASPGGDVLVLEGEAGIGKTALLDIACARATARGVCVARASADDFVLEPPLGVLLRALESLWPVGDELVLRWPPEIAAGDPSAVLGGGSLPAIVVDQLIDALEAAGARSPVLVVLDDLQWADDSTVTVLVTLARRTRGLGVSFLLATRPAPRSPAMARSLVALERDGASVAPLPPLTDPEVAELLEHRTDRDLSDREARLVQAAGGNPWFILEVLAAVERSERDPGELASENGLPASLRSLLVRRVESEGEELATMLRVAAVVGRRVVLSELIRLLRTTPLDLAPRVAAAIEHGWWVEEGGELAFRHDLVREALLEVTPLALQTELHREVAAALTEEGAGPERIAYHLAQSIDPPDPATVARILELVRSLPRPSAGAILAVVRDRLPIEDPDRAAVEVAYCDSLVWSNDPGLGEELARDALKWITEPELVYDLEAARSYALFQLGRPVEAVQFWENARPGGVAEMTPYEHAQISIAKLFAGDMDGADTSATIAIEDPSTPGHGVRIARFTRAWIAASRGDLGTALHETEIALDDALANPEPGRLPHDVPQLYRAAMLDSAGRGEEALELLGRNYPNTADLGSASVAVLRHASKAMLLYRMGRWDEARAEAEAGSSLSTESGVGLGLGLLIGTQSLIALHSGDPDRAAAILANQPTDLLGPTMGLEWMAFAKVSLDQVRGQNDVALATLVMAMEIAMAVGAAVSCTYLGIEAARIASDGRDGGTIGRLVDAIDAVPDTTAIATTVAARAHLHGLLDGDADALAEVAATVRAMPRPWEAGRCFHDAAIAAARADDGAAARRHAASAVELFEQIGARGSVAQLRSDLRTEGIQMRRAQTQAEPVDAWDALTPTQKVVVQMVGEGLSNGQIAERLFVSRRTVESHLGRVYQQLGLPSRVALVQAAAARATPVASPTA
jgi:DNA-binding CsgD family transcriptional regulator/tetratricopeptide (TPR) repeat protein